MGRRRVEDGKIIEEEDGKSEDEMQRRRGYGRQNDVRSGSYGNRSNRASPTAEV
jgi:hypothetical protein